MNEPVVKGRVESRRWGEWGVGEAGRSVWVGHVRNLAGQKSSPMGGVGVPAPEIGGTGGRGSEEFGGATPPVSVRTQAAVVEAWSMCAAGLLEGLGGVQAGSGEGAAVEILEGSAGPEEGGGVGQRPEAVVWRGNLVMGVAFPDAAVGCGDLGGEEAGPVEEGESESRRKALTSGARWRGMWAWPSHLPTTLPVLGFSTRALSWDRRGPDLVNSRTWSLVSCLATRWLMYSEHCPNDG